MRGVESIARCLLQTHPHLGPPPPAAPPGERARTCFNSRPQLRAASLLPAAQRAPRLRPGRQAPPPVGAAERALAQELRAALAPRPRGKWGRLLCPREGVLQLRDLGHPPGRGALGTATPPAPASPPARAGRGGAARGGDLGCRGGGHRIGVPRPPPTASWRRKALHRCRSDRPGSGAGGRGDRLSPPPAVRADAPLRTPLLSCARSPERWDPFPTCPPSSLPISPRALDPKGTLHSPERPGTLRCAVWGKSRWLHPSSQEAERCAAVRPGLGQGPPAPRSVMHDLGRGRGSLTRGPPEGLARLFSAPWGDGPHCIAGVQTHPLAARGLGIPGLAFLEVRSLRSVSCYLTGSLRSPISGL